MEEIKLKIINEPRLEYNAVNNPTDAVKMMQDLIGDMDREYLAVVNINASGKPINYNIVSVGTIDKSLASISNILKSAILTNAAAIMLFHNHPSLELKASPADIELTSKLYQGCNLMGIRFLDHIIVSNNGYNSMKNSELINDLITEKYPLKFDTLTIEPNNECLINEIPEIYKEVEITMGENTYKVPLVDYLEMMASQNGYNSYKELYNDGLRVPGYENISPELFNNKEEEHSL